MLQVSILKWTQSKSFTENQAKYPPCPRKYQNPAFKFILSVSTLAIELFITKKIELNYSNVIKCKCTTAMIVTWNNQKKWKLATRFLSTDKNRWLNNFLPKNVPNIHRKTKQNKNKLKSIWCVCSCVHSFKSKTEQTHIMKHTYMYINLCRYNWLFTNRQIYLFYLRWKTKMKLFILQFVTLKNMNKIKQNETYMCKTSMQRDISKSSQKQTNMKFKNHSSLNGTIHCVFKYTHYKATNVQVFTFKLIEVNNNMWEFK